MPGKLRLELVVEVEEGTMVPIFIEPIESVLLLGPDYVSDSSAGGGNMVRMDLVSWNPVYLGDE